MSINKTRSNYDINTEEFEVYCDADKCREDLILEVNDWQDLMKHMRDDGWTAKKIDGEWHHSGSADQSGLVAMVQPRLIKLIIARPQICRASRAIQADACDRGL